MSKPLVTLTGVGVRHRGDPPVLHDLELRLVPGRPVAVLGANGSGKSTLLRVVAGCTRPGTGRVRGRPRTVGYVPDRFPSQLRMPAASYLRHMAALHGIAPAAAGRDAAELLDELGFNGGLDVAMARLSKGNAQKVALTQALCSAATLLVLDEPWSGLDRHAVAAVTARIARAAGDGAAVLITDHTRTAATVPGCAFLELRDGRLHPFDHPPAPTSTTVVTLVTDDPRRVLSRLPADGPATVLGDRITVRVPVERRDALLAAALELGCGVHAVEPARTT